MGLLYDWFKLFHWRSLLTFTSFPIFTSRCQYKISNVCRNSPQQIPLFTACSSDKNSGSKSAPVRPCSVNISLSLSQGFCSDTTPFSFMVAHLELTRWPLKDSAAQPASSKVAVQCPCWSKIIYAVNFFATSKWKEAYETILEWWLSGDFFTSRRIKKT